MLELPKIRGQTGPWPAAAAGRRGDGGGEEEGEGGAGGGDGRQGEASAGRLPEAGARHPAPRVRPAGLSATKNKSKDFTPL